MKEAAGAQNSMQLFSMAIAQNTLLQGGFGRIRGCYMFCHVRTCSHVLEARPAQGLLHKHLVLMFPRPKNSLKRQQLLQTSKHRLLQG